MGIDDLRAASVILGDKSYVFGEESTVIVAIIFGYVTRFLYLTEDGNVFKKAICGELKNLKDHHERIKDEYWSDWDECRGPRP